MIGIVSYGFYIPKYRVTVDEIGSMWGKNPSEISASLNVIEKTVPAQDEDTLSMAYEASSMALGENIVPKKDIGVVYVGSETHPYAVNPTSTILAEFLGITGEYLASDTQFACKAATGAIISAQGLIASGFTKNALVVGSDRATGKPHDALEYTAASASVSLLLGQTNVAVEIVDALSFSSDTPDFWRREGIRYPSHGGRFTGKPSYFHHVYSASKKLLDKNKLHPQDFAHCIFHMPNGKFPQVVSGMLGFTKEQTSQSLVVSLLGNSYTASALMGLVHVLDIAKPNDLIFMASFGSGAGSDAFVLKVTPEIVNVRKSLSTAMENKEYINYATYIKQMGLI